MKRTKVQAMLMLAGLGVIASGAAGAPQLYNLGSGNEPTAISDNGVVAGTGGYFTLGEYFTWTVQGGIVGIGGVLPSDGFGGQASISSDGTRIGGTALNPDTGFGEMGIYDTGTGTWTIYGGLGTTVDFSTSSGWGISGDGNHLVGLGWTGGFQGHAMQWSNGVGSFDLGSTVPGNSSRANATNHDGSVVGGWQDNMDGFRQGAVWINGVQTLIYDNDGFEVSEVLDVSADGRWVTGVTYWLEQTYRYDTLTGDFEYIDSMDIGFFSPTALGTGITDDGKTIIGSVRDFGPPIFGTGFIWREGIGTMTMNDYFDSIGLAYEPGTIFSMPFAISGDGMMMSGMALTPDFDVIGWVVVIPSPASAGVLGLAGFAGMIRRRR